MFDDLRDPQPSEPDDDTLASDELLSDLPGTGDADSALSSFDEPAAPRFGDDIPVAPARSERLVLGMTAQQRMILSVFLFLDVSVLGCVLLLAAGAISIP